MISCKYCLFRFDGDIVCMNCATGYKIKFDPGHHPGVGQTFPIVKMYHMTTSRIDGKIRCKVFTDEETTDLTITVAAKLIDFGGETHTGLHYPTDELTCPRCEQRRMQFYLEKPDVCPQCHKRGLHKHVTFGPILLPPKDSG